MFPVRPVYFLMLCSALFGAHASAQHRKLDCPRPVRERAYHQAPAARLELSAGMLRPIMYRNGGSLGADYRFGARTMPFATLTLFMRVSEGVDAYLGLSATQIWQGLHYRHADRSSTIDVASYTGSTSLSVPLGFRIKATERLSIDVGGFVAYSSHSGTEEESRRNGTSSSFYTYSSPDFNGLNFGLRFGADFRISGRFGAGVFWSADALHAAPSSSTANPGATPSTASAATLEPSLMQLGVGLRYILFARGTATGSW